MRGLQEEGAVQSILDRAASVDLAVHMEHKKPSAVSSPPMTSSTLRDAEVG